jgi:subtilisin family serine protease
MRIMRASLLLFVFLFAPSCFLKAQSNVLENELYLKFKESNYQCTALQPPKEVTDFLLVQQAIQDLDSVKCTFWFSRNSDLKRTYRLWFSNEVAAKIALQKLSESSDIEYVEQVPKLIRFLTPNDLGPNSTADGGQWYHYKVKSQQAWDLQTGLPQIRVAVIDDAIQINHPDLNGVCYPGYDAAQEDFDVQPPTGSHDHGTHVSGLIGAITNNNIGLASLAHGVFILPIKATFDSNPDVVVGGYEGMAWAVTNLADVINCSWGSDAYSQTGLTVVNDALNSNAVVVAAAGNFNSMVVQYPAGYDGVISVASTTTTDNRSSFSSYGSWIDISAPGNQIWSSVPFDAYQRKDGTSFAAPLVSALAALMKSRNSALTPGQIEACIKNSSDPIDFLNPGFEGLLGAGRINAEQAIICLGIDTLSYNLKIEQIENLVLYSCVQNQQPKVRVKNDGDSTVTSFRMRVQLDNEFPFLYNFNDTLLPNETVLIDLPEIVLAPGNHTYTAQFFGLINSSFSDSYLPGNQSLKSFKTLSPVGSPLPFTENFELGNFLTNGWFLVNEDSPFSWEIVQSPSPALGSRAARLNYYVDQESYSKDLLYSEPLDFSAYSSISFAFDHAYKQRFVGISDSLIVSISDDCGLTWNRLVAWYENGNNDFATKIAGADNFLPATGTEWCGQPNFAECSEFDLSDYAGQTNVIVRFEGYSMNGNNIYIDNINISGIANNQPPVASFNAAWDLPVCSSKQVAFASTSTGIPSGFQWTFSGGNPAESTLPNPVINYSTPGNYDVQLIVQNAFGSDTLLWVDYVEVLESPFVTITTDSDTICIGASANLTASGALNYIWNSGQAMSANDGEEITVSPITSANYIVNGINSAGCADTALQRVVVVTSPPQPSITVNGGTLVASSGSAYEWYFNGALVENANEQFYTPTANGNYNVRVFIPGGCSSISGIFPVNFVGIDELFGFHRFALHPNPAKEVVNFYVPFDHVVWHIFDGTGRLIQGGIASKSWINIDTRDFAEGLYLVRLSGDKLGNASTKFVVKH